MTDKRFDDGPFLTLADFAEQAERRAWQSTPQWKTWPDYDEDGPNGRTIIGTVADAPIFVTCKGIPPQWAEGIAEILNSVEIRITLATTKE